MNALSEFFLITTKTQTPASLRAHGYRIQSIARAVTFESANSKKCFNEILELRRHVHLHEGVERADMSSPFDSHSRHLICRFGEQVVSYVRVIYVENDPEKASVWRVPRKVAANVPRNGLQTS